MEQLIAKVKGTDVSATARFAGGTKGEAGQSSAQGAAGGQGGAAYRGAQFLRAPTSALRSPIAAAKQFRRERAT